MTTDEKDRLLALAVEWDRAAEERKNYDARRAYHRCADDLRFILTSRPMCMWTGKDDEGQTRYCAREPRHDGPHRDTVGYEFTGGAPHPSTPEDR